MSASLAIRSLTASRGPRRVLDDVDVVVGPDDRLGIIGPNGVGKSTLLAIAAGAPPDGVTIEAGRVSVTPPIATVGLLAQEPHRSLDETVVEFIRRRTGVAAAQRELDRAVEALAAGDRDSAGRYDTALDRWMRLGAADFDVRIDEHWDRTGLPTRLLDQATATLSGGEAAQAQLASILLSRFDVVLLDEPTNDLDLEALDRLERWIDAIDAPALIVSHDRAFLERTITGVLELDEHTHRAHRYDGGWQAYLDERALARRHAQERYEAYAEKRAGLLARAQREREWATQGLAKVRRSDEPDKFIRHAKIAQTERLAGRAARTERSIERLEVVDEPRDGWELRLRIPTAGRSGEIVARARDLVVDRDGFRLGPLDVEIVFGDRVVLLGANGSGKTTLIDVLLGRLAPTAGTTYLGPSVVVGEISQTHRRLRGVHSVLDTFRAALSDRGVDAKTDVEMRTLLAKFGIGADHVMRPADTLSPGERTRTALALLQAVGANFLVLDEPTNHLDLPAIEQLEQVLATFEGTVLLVTHDRRLLEHVSTTRRLRLGDGQLSEMSGGVSGEVSGDVSGTDRPPRSTSSP